MTVGETLVDAIDAVIDYYESRAMGVPGSAIAALFQQVSSLNPYAQASGSEERRANGATLADLAAEFGVHHATISRIARGIWRADV